MRKGKRYALYRRMDGPWSKSRRCEVEKTLFPLLAIELLLLGSAASSKSLYRLVCHASPKTLYIITAKGINEWFV
jgi:hypothetical protein